MPRRMRKQREDYDPNYVPEDEDPTPTETPEIEDPDFAPGEDVFLGDSDQYVDLYVPHSTYEKPTKSTITPDPKPTPDPYSNLDETDESQIYVPRSTYERLRRESPPEPVQEHPIQEHKHLNLDDLVDDDPEQDLGAGLIDDYLSRSTYVLEPTPPKEPRPTKHRRRTIDDISPDDTGLIDETYKKIYESQSTYDVGEMGSVILGISDKLIEKSKKTARETKIVSHSEPILESDAIGMDDTPLEDQLGGIYESKSTYEIEKSLEGAGEYFTGVTLSGGVSFMRGAAYTVNPLEWARSAHDLTYLARSRYAQKQFAESVEEDPFRFLVDLGSGIAGGWAAGKFIGNLFNTPDEIKYDIPEKELSRTIKRTDGRISPREYDLLDIKKNVLHKVAGWDEIPVAQFDDLGSGFSAYHPKRGTWPKPVKGFWAKSTGHDLILTESMIIPTSKFYKPRIDYFTGLEGLSHLTPNLSWMQTISPGRSISAYPFMGMGAIFGLSSKATPDIYDPLGIEKIGTIQKSTPKIDDTGLGEIPKIIERVDETYKQKPDLVDPFTILKPIHEPKQDPLIEPGYKPYPPEEIPKIIERLDEDLIPILIPPSFIQDLEQEPKQDQPQYIPPFFPEFLEGPTQKPPIPRKRYKEPDEKLIDKSLFPDIFGLKKKTSRIATPQESFMSMLFGGPPKKKKRKKKRKKKS